MFKYVCMYVFTYAHAYVCMNEGICKRACDVLTLFPVIEVPNRKIKFDLLID